MAFYDEYSQKDETFLEETSEYSDGNTPAADEHKPRENDAPRYIPEPINLSDNGQFQQSFVPQMTPATENPSTPDSDQAEHQETGEYYPETYSPEEYDLISDGETPAFTEYRSPAERLAEYADCHSKLIPAGTDISSLNQKYLYSLRYGREWGFSTVMLPVSAELADGLCLDKYGNPISPEDLRAMRDAAGSTGLLCDPGEIDSLYEKKTAVISRNGINIDDFENAEVNGASINCFSSFVKNKVTTCDVLMLQVPVSDPWNVFGWISCGGLANTPSDILLTTSSKRWYELCGAVPAVLGFGEIEYFVPNGMPSRETAEQIAKDQFALCHQRVLRLTRSHMLAELTDTLTKSCVWYLGWK